MIVLVDCVLYDVVRYFVFFEEDGDFFVVWSGLVVKIDYWVFWMLVWG